MDSLLPLLLNIVYGFFFFLAFGVLIATVILFAIAVWDTVGRWMLKRFQNGNDL